MNRTSHLQLNLPEYVDLADVQKLNDNMVIIDSELYGKMTKPLGGSVGNYLTIDSSGNLAWGGPVTTTLIRDAVTRWLGNNINPSTTIVIDDTLSHTQQAADAKAVGDLCALLEEKITMLSNKIMFNLQDVPLTDFSVLSFRIEKTNKKWYSLNNAGYFIHLPAECKQILIKGNASFKTHYAFLTALSPVANDVAPLVGEVNVIPLGTMVESIVPSGANYLYIMRMNGDGKRTDPDLVSFYLEDDTEDFTGIIGEILALRNAVSESDTQMQNVSSLLTAIDYIVNGEIQYNPIEKTTSNMTGSRFYIHGETGIAYDYSGNTSYVEEIGECKKVLITANGSYNTHYAFLSSNALTNNTAAPIVGGTLPTVVQTGQTVEVDVPNGATHFYIRRLDASGHNMFPDDLYFEYEKRVGGLATDAYVISTKNGTGTLKAGGATARPALSVKFSVLPAQGGRGTPSESNIRQAMRLSSFEYTFTRTVTEGTPVTVSLGMDLYGGTVDIVNGEITEEYHCHTFTGQETFIPSGVWVVVSLGLDNKASMPEEGFCSHAEFHPYRAGCIGVMRNEDICVFDGSSMNAEQWAAYCANQYALGTPVQVVYKLKTPKTYQIDPRTIALNVGNNYFTSSVNGPISVKYYMDINSAFAEMNGDSEEEEMQESTMDSTPTANSVKPVTSDGIYNALQEIRGMLPYDTTPTLNSNNPVTSDGVARGLSDKQDILTFDSAPAANSQNPVTSEGIKNAIDAITSNVSSVVTSVLAKVSKPISSPNGTNGQILKTNGDGTTEWITPSTPTSAQVAEALNNWFDDNPDATTTVEDYSLVANKLVKGTLGYYTPDMYGAVGDGITDDHDAIQAAITAAGVGGVVKFLKGKIYNIGTSGFTILEGQTITGGGTLLQTENGNGAVCVIYTADCATVDGITIVQQNYHTGYGIKIAGDNVTVKNCRVYNKYVGMTGDNIFGDNVLIQNNIVTYTRNGIYVSRGASQRRRTGLQVLDNISLLCEGYDTSLGGGQNKGINIGGCSGAIVRGNIILGANMCFCSYRWTDHTIYDHNISDQYVSVIGDYNVVTNNIIDGDLTPEIHYPITSVGMMCAIEVVGDASTVSNNIVRNNGGPGISCNDPKRHGIIIKGNYIENCATHPNSSTAAINIMGQSDAIICNNIIRNCSGSTKGYGAINMAGYKLYPISNITITGNIMEGIQNNNTLGAIYFRYANNIKIDNNILRCTGRCLCFGIDCQFVRNVYISNNIFEGNSFANDWSYTNEIRMWENDMYKVVLDVSNTKALCKNKFNEGFIAAMPQRCTWEIGEIYPTIEGLKRCTTAGTLGSTTVTYIYADTVKATTTQDSSVISVNVLGAVMLTVGQYITIEGAVDKARINSIELLYNDSNNISGANVTLSVNAAETVVLTNVTYSPPAFTTIR